MTAMEMEEVETGFLGGAAGLPLVISPRRAGLDSARWAAENREWIEEQLHRYGALLFRGFSVDEVAGFEAFAEVICGQLYGEYEDLPKERGGRRVYQATPYPAEKTILFHNESSHMHRFPIKQFFFCLVAAREGGETPVVDGREIYRRLSAEVIEELRRRKLMYIRNYIEGFDVGWRDFFRTEDRADVEAYCRAHGISFEWHGDDLQTRQVAPAVARHPKTGEDVFFNQIQLHHRACLEPDLREALEAVLGEDNLPRNVRFGDGEEIDDQLVREISRMYWDCSVAFRWQERDLLMLDNILCSHARNPYVGPRRIAVAMGEIVRADEVA
jgi:alpha-ketoglutarate-dependent taurine dioxygenase